MEFFEQTVERESVEATLELMSHPVSMVRHQALATLLKTAPGEHSEFIIGLLDDPDRDIRTFAVRSMTQFDTPGVTQALIIQLADPDERVTLEVAKALATKKGKLPLDTLIASVTSDQAATALGAIATLEALKSPIPLEVLKQAIGAEDLRVAAKAVRALLTGLDGPRAKHIEASLNAPRGEVRRVAVETLHEGHPTTAPAPTWLAESTLLEHLVKATRDAEEQVRASAVDALGERTAIDAVLERLAPALKDPSPIVRTAAYVRLSVRRAAGTAALLLPSLDTERDPHALGHLALSLARLEEKSAVEPLIGLLARATDKYARRQLSTALKKLTGQQLGTAAKRWREWLTEQEQGAPKTP